jgi:glycerol-3-phosphate dehydrogenase
VYDFLAGVKKSERRTMLSVHETLSKEPLVKKEELKGAGYYVEYRTDDARLTIEVLKEAVNRGATAINYSKVTELIYADGKIVGVEVTDGLNGTTYKIFAKKVINATGPWVDTLREKDRSKKGKNLRLTKGVHLVFDQSKFPLKQSVYFDTPDGRMVFAIPRDGKTYVGTTDTFFDKDIKSPKITSEDRQYIIKCVNYMFPSVSLKESDIESSWAGVRPLIYEEGKDPSEISRKDEIWQSQTGMITIAGGKLTGYRKMAETVVDLLVNLFEEESGRSFKTCQTKTLPISGGAVGGASNFNDFIHQYEHKALELGLTKQDYMKLSRMYGSNIEVLLTLVPSYTEETSYRLPIILFLQLMYGIQHEMICKPVDFFIRRTGALFFDINTVIQSKDKVISCMSDKLGWTEEQRDEYTKELEEQLFNAINPTEET